MTQYLLATQTRAEAFDTVVEAERVIRRLLAAGISRKQLAVICPAKFKDHFRLKAPQANAPKTDAASAIAMGGAVGATLGGLALAATFLNGSVAGGLAVDVFIGGGAIAGGFSYLIVSKGDEQEADDVNKQAIKRGQILVGVEVQPEDSAGQLADVEHILNAARSISPLSM